MSALAFTAAPKRRLDPTPLARLYAAWRSRQLHRRNPIASQTLVLQRLLRRARATRFGREHGFDKLATVADYQRAVPVRRYEEFWRDYWRPSFPRLEDVTWPGVVPFFAVSSGTTTGATKYIPCTAAMNRANRRAAFDVFVHHLTRRPQSHVFAGRSFMLGGSTGLTELAPGIFAGDLSGIAGKTVPGWARPFYFPPPELEAIADWEEKIARLAPASLGADIRALGGTTSWLLLFFEKLARLSPASPRRLAAHYPRLELIVHGGVGFAPYRPAFAHWLKGSRAETREVFAASEGFIAVADRGDGEGLRLITDNGLFFEFIPVEELDRPSPTRHWLANVEMDMNYALVLTTCAGLWSYVVGDTVRFLERRPPRLLITGRTAYTLSAFGEHLIGEEIEAAVARAAAAIGATVRDFAVGAIFPSETTPRGHHLFILEFADAIPDPDRLCLFTRALDAALADRNDDYRAHRQGDYGMAPPVVRPVAPGAFASWMKQRGKLGGQNKVPRVIHDPSLLADLRAFIGDSPRAD